MTNEQHDTITFIYCPQCGAENRAIARFCIRCGAPLQMQDYYHNSQFVRLRQNLIEYFSASELQTLCFDMGVDYDLLPGEGKEDKARELIYYVIRRGLVPEFINTCFRLRPHVSWEFTPGTPHTTPPIYHSSANTTLDNMFLEATHYHLRGDLGYALQLYRQLKQIAPTYPRIDVTIASVEREIQAGYVDAYGRVREREVMHPPATMMLPAAEPRDNASRPAGYSCVVRIAIVLGITLIIVMGVLIYLWLRGMLG